MNTIIRLLVAAALTLTLTSITATTPNPSHGTPTDPTAITFYTHFGTEQRPGNTGSSTGTRHDLTPTGHDTPRLSNPTHRISA